MDAIFFHRNNITFHRKLNIQYLTFKIQYSEFNIYKATYLNHVNGSFETFNIKEIEYYSKNMFFYRKSIYLT